MTTPTPSIPARIALSATIGFSVLVGLFVLCVGLLGQTNRLHYDTGIVALILCGVAAAAISATVVYGPFKTYTIGEKNRDIITVAAWCSVFLPLATFVESAFFFTMSFWWFLFPAHFIVGGFLGITVAILKQKWWWALWGVIATLFGVLWIAAVLFWPK